MNMKKTKSQARSKRRRSSRRKGLAATKGKLRHQSSSKQSSSNHGHANGKGTQSKASGRKAAAKKGASEASLLPVASWKTLAEATVGLAHRKQTPPLPCQDAVASAQNPRALLVLADGAGSAPLSHQGAHQVVISTLRLLRSLEPQLAYWLDRPEGAKSAPPIAPAQLLDHAIGSLEDLADQMRRPWRDLHCTLVVIASGRRQHFWLKVGDSAIVSEHLRPQEPSPGDHPTWKPELVRVGPQGKEEFANQTAFVGPELAAEDWHWGLLPAGDISGLAVLSDGAAEKLMSHDGSQVSGRISRWLDELRQGRLYRHHLTAAFYDPAFTRNTAGDDRSIALAAACLGGKSSEPCSPAPNGTSLPATSTSTNL